MKLLIKQQEGQVGLLVVGICVVLFAVAGLAIDGTRAWLARRSLHNAVDSAVLAGANELDPSRLYGRENEARPLDPASARAAALEMLSQNPSVDEVEVIADRRGVSAVARAAVPTSFLGLVGIDEVSVAAEAYARPLFGED